MKIQYQPFNVIAMVGASQMKATIDIWMYVSVDMYIMGRHLAGGGEYINVKMNINQSREFNKYWKFTIIVGSDFRRSLDL